MKKILLVHGPNLNLTGIREPGIYGRNSLAAINEEVVLKCERLGMLCSVFQSNSEGALIDRLHAAMDDCDGIIINAGAYTHYSYAIRDALASLEIPKIEVHISTVHKREEFRHVSVTAPVCTGQIVGLGLFGYVLAMDYLTAPRN